MVRFDFDVVCDSPPPKPVMPPDVEPEGDAPDIPVATGAASTAPREGTQKSRVVAVESS